MSKGIGGHHRGFKGKSDVWLTPPEIVKALGPFDFDPCGCADAPWLCAEMVATAGGLDQPWHGRVWLNPPYGPEAAKWISRLAYHGNGIAILFARTETKMFFESVWTRADAIFFFEGRLHFHRGDGVRAKANAGGPSCLIAYGRDNVGAIAKAEIPGMLVDLRQSCQRTHKGLDYGKIAAALARGSGGKVRMFDLGRTSQFGDAILSPKATQP